MPEMDILALIVGPGGAAITMAIGVWAFATGRVVRGSEYTELYEKYEALRKQYVQDLEERARTAPALAEMAERRQREIDDYIRSRREAANE